MTDKDLSTGTLKLKYSIKSRFPNLSDSEVESISSMILDEVAKRIGAGEQLAFFRLDSQGQAEIITYALEQLSEDS